MAETVTVNLYDANKGKAPRTGIYRDELEAEQAEVRRAKLEDREPDLDNPPATAATQLVPKEYLRETDTDKSHFSDKVEVQNEPVSSFEYTPPEHPQDENQVDFDNNMDVVNAVRARADLDQAKKDKDDDQLSEEQETVLDSEAQRAQGEADKYNA